MTLVELAQKLRPYIEKAAISLSDEDAIEAVNLFPNWRADESYTIDQRVKYNEILYIDYHNKYQENGSNMANIKHLYLNKDIASLKEKRELILKVIDEVKRKK